MGGPIPFLILFSYYYYYYSLGDALYNSTNTPLPDNATSLVPPTPPPSPPGFKEETAPFRPSIAVIVGVLTTIFSLTFLLLLYAKHCKRTGPDSNGVVSSTSGRKNSGIERAVIESLPIFRFGSLMGQKDGLECAVCLNRFEPTEVLRLLPKCKHAFHVECVDTWLDAHSTCPLCRYRVDPEDVLLIHEPNCRTVPFGVKEEEEEPVRRVSGRHSSAGERGVNNCSTTSFSLRRSLDSFGFRKKTSSRNNNNNNNSNNSDEFVAVGCFDRYTRKDGLLLTREENNSEEELVAVAVDAVPSVSVVADVAEGEGADDINRTRFEHRINVVSCSNGTGVVGAHVQRWSDVQPSDLLCLRSEILMSDDSRRYSASGSRPSDSSRHKRSTILSSDGRSVINTRSVSEITGISRFSPSLGRGNNNNNNNNNRQHRGLVSRWWASVSSSYPSDSSHSLPAIRSIVTADNAPTTNV